MTPSGNAAPRHERLGRFTPHPGGTARPLCELCDPGDHRHADFHDRRRHRAVCALHAIVLWHDSYEDARRRLREALWLDERLEQILPLSKERPRRRSRVIVTE